LSHQRIEKIQAQWLWNERKHIEKPEARNRKIQKYLELDEGRDLIKVWDSDNRLRPLEDVTFQKYIKN
jgi:hypothetical protein